MEIDSGVFSDQKIGKLLIKFAIPTILSLLVMELYNMVDTIFVGSTIGAIGIGALTIALPIQKLISSTGLMMAVGTSTAVSRNLGKKRFDKIRKIILNSLILTSLVLSLLCITIFIFRNYIIKNLLGSSESLFPYAYQYISIILVGGIFQCLTLVIGYVIMSLGDTKLTLKATSLGAIINVILDLILVVHFSMGVKGAAIATTFSQILAFIYAFKKFIKVKKEIDLEFKFSFEIPIVKSIITVGFSTFIVEVSDGLLSIVFNNLLSVHGGDDAVVIIGTITKLSMFLFITVIGISSAMQPIAAFNYGAKNYQKLKLVIKETIIFITVTTLIVWGGMFLFPSYLIGIFLKDTELLIKAVKAFRIVIIIFPCVGIYYVSIYCCQALGKAKSSFILSIYRETLVCIPAAAILVYKLGTMGAWIAYPVADFISCITGLFYIRKIINNLKKIN
ncbi:MATE family efflux transporter [Clostridium botulinum]|uniref:Multidrug export protein MepA n=1 Tax=Clostridium botulinum TaxID=1491 RepID=A0A9Q1UZE6_CLOBO|nr:MATE family efflux transporter [Clostridium botulinum]KEH99037.1 multidrug transporter MatE [Clostridium botulinum C/D str. Sp77]KEI04189.1 multidrug transporter MatE [Clostridium botulinum D str. 16868]KLU75823.1 multidrug transporter MatE [Clostridium botulinum V891]KOA74655.1 multidrug transporter MatE [Clostridium botulinum]KOA77526.1 multidrug transporter MatE [Clostridium botulinum]